MAKGITLAGDVPDIVYGDYLKGRQQQQISRKSIGRGESVIDFIYSNLEGLLLVIFNRIKYFITINNDVTIVIQIEDLKYKLEIYKKVTK